jgi:phenylpropionate dioxygenase-like ring-hydroxylating dioxygenase large terminal subunit
MQAPSTAVEPVAEKSGWKTHVVRVEEAWYPAGFSDEIGTKAPVARTILGVPLAVFRDASGAPRAVLDRCPHRIVPLSLGDVCDGELRCRYHGWQFDGAGRCTKIPGLPIVDGEACDKPGRRATAFPAVEQDGIVWIWPAVEQDGIVWIWASSTSAPTTKPFALPQTTWPGYLTFRRQTPIRGTLYSTLENILDVPHTSFLHGGLFRQAEKKHSVEAIITRDEHGVAAEYVGEPRPSGIAGRIISPSGGVVTHFDRFFLPSIAQVEYRLGDENHLVTTTVCTPVSESFTRMYTVLSLRTRVNATLLAPFIVPFAGLIVKQDADVLAAQTDLVARFQGEKFSSTPLDVLGAHILLLLKRAERGAIDASVRKTERMTINV